MPIVTIQVTDEGVSKEQKRQLIKQSTDMLEQVLNKDPSLTFVIIEEVSTDNWGAGGVPALEYRQQQTLRK